MCSPTPNPFLRFLLLAGPGDPAEGPARANVRRDPRRPRPGYFIPEGERPDPLARLAELDAILDVRPPARA
jgi:hypothetical protein